jgi:hypothetical protein
MCDKCQELEKKIERYRTLATRLFDQPTIEAINKLIEEMQAKAGLHPSPQALTGPPRLLGESRMLAISAAARLCRTDTSVGGRFCVN